VNPLIFISNKFRLDANNAKDPVFSLVFPNNLAVPAKFLAVPTYCPTYIGRRDYLSVIEMPKIGIVRKIGQDVPSVP